MTNHLIKSVNPYTLETIGEYSNFDSKMINQALLNAEKAFKSERLASFSKKREKMLKVGDILRGRKDELAHIITAEMGKTLAEAVAEIEKSALCCTYFAEEAERMLKPTTVLTDKKDTILHQPIGAVFAVMPWNFPFWQVFRFAAPTLMAGNVAILKHAGNVTGCALAIEKVFQEAGFEHVFQTLILDIKDIKKIVQSPIVQAVTLTGSEKAGASLASLAAKNIKKGVLELGGSDAFLIMDDADVENAAKNAIQSRMQNAGQSCLAAKRFFVTEKNFDAFLNFSLKAISNFKQGNPLDPSVKMGPMARVDLAEALDKQLQDALTKGAKIVAGGDYQNANFQPTLITDCTTNMAVFKEETFGPLGCIFVVKNEKEMITRANQSRFGLACSVWSNDWKKAEKTAHLIESGNVFINKMVKSDPKLPFGGIKKSGFGREMGDLGILEFTNAKVIAV